MTPKASPFRTACPFPRRRGPGGTVCPRALRGKRCRVNPLATLGVGMDKITISVPPEADFLPAIRLVIGGIGARSRLSYDQVSELQLAVESLVAREHCRRPRNPRRGRCGGRAISLVLGPFEPERRPAPDARGRAARRPRRHRRPERRPVGRARLRGLGGMNVATERERSAFSHAYKEDGDRAARERLIADLMPLVRSLALRYAGRGESLDDLVQVGSIGLINAIDRFDPERGVELRPTPSRRSSARSSGTSATRPGRSTCRGASRSSTSGCAHPRPLTRRARPLADDRGARAGGGRRGGTGDRGARVRPCLHGAQPLAPARRRSGGRSAELIGEEERGYEEVEEGALVDAGLDGSDPRERRIVELRFFHG